MRPTLLATAALCAVVAGCGSDASDDDSSGSSGGGAAAGGGFTKTDKVDIKDFKFEPKDIEVKAGATVTFTDGDTAPHTATSQPQGSFDSGKIVKGAPKTVTFKKAGTFNYYCVYHAFMKGRVKVDR